MTIDGISYSPDSGNPSLTVISDVTITPNGWGKMTVTTG
jgi:hypothetical protein